MNKYVMGIAFLALLVASIGFTDANPVSKEDITKYLNEMGLSDAKMKQFSSVIDDLASKENKKETEKGVALGDDDDDDDGSQVKEKLINFINKVDKLVKKMNPKKFYEEKVKKSKYYKFFFGDDDEDLSD